MEDYKEKFKSFSAAHLSNLTATEAIERIAGDVNLIHEPDQPLFTLSAEYKRPKDDVIGGKAVIIINNGEPGAALTNGLVPRLLTENEERFVASLSNRRLYPKGLGSVSVSSKLKLFRLLISHFAAAYEDTPYYTFYVVSAAQVCLESAFCTALAGRFNFNGQKLTGNTAANQWFELTDGGKISMNDNPDLPARLTLTSENNLSLKEIAWYRNNYFLDGDGKKQSWYVGSSERRDLRGRTYTFHKVWDLFKNNKTLVDGLAEKVRLMNVERNAIGKSYKACQNVGTIRGTADCIRSAGYATDVSYGEKIERLIAAYNRVCWYMSASGSSSHIDTEILSVFVGTSHPAYIRKIFDPRKIDRITELLGSRINGNG